MATLLSFPVLGILLIFQTVIVSHLSLIHGTADVILLFLIAWSLQDQVPDAWIWTLLAGFMVSFISAMPMFAPMIAYIIATAITRLLQRRVWQTPVLAMFVATVASSLIQLFLYVVVINLNGTALPLGESISQVILPGTFLNLLLSLPVYALVSDMASWVHPIEVEV